MNHPNIAQIHGLENADGTTALVMELVEGPTLADRIAQGAIPLDEALPIAKQIVEALEAAHERGIIHRDLKPANVKVRPDDTVKILDFGLAKAMEPARAMSPVVSMSPTIMSPAMTRTDVILGTAAYMSPEQARGKPLDNRTDIWAFGCVLYEMLTGKRTFAGEEVSDALAEVIKSEPVWSALPTDTPPPIRRLLRRCLEKDRRERLPEIGTARLEINDAQAAPAAEHLRVTAMPSTAASPTRWRRIASAAVPIVAAASMSGLAVWWLMRPVPPSVSRLTILPPTGAALAVNNFDRDVAISPDGSRVAYLGPEGTIVVRALDQLEPTALKGLGAVGGLFFSPDGQWIGYSQGGNALSKVALTGGAPVTICRLEQAPRGAVWLPDDTIVFGAGGDSGLWRVPASGGTPTVLTRPNTSGGEVSHSWPEALPGIQAVLFTIFPPNAGEDRSGVQVAVLDLKTGTEKVLIRGGGHAHYVESGHLVYQTGEMLRAAAFDVKRLEVVGGSVPVVPEVVTKSTSQLPTSVSPDGKRLVLDVQQVNPLRLLTLPIDPVFPRPGDSRRDPLPGPVPLFKTMFSGMNGEISPDGRWLAYQSDESGRFEIYVRPFPDADSRHWQVSTAGGTRPLWTRRSDELFYVAANGDLMTAPIDRGGAMWKAGVPARLLDNSHLWVLTTFAGRSYDVSPDGQRFLAMKPAGGAEPAPTPSTLVVVQNWTEELKRLVPTN